MNELRHNWASPGRPSFTWRAMHGERFDQRREGVGSELHPSIGRPARYPPFNQIKDAKSC